MEKTRLPTAYQDFVHRSRYARYLHDEHRRETWEETVTRYVDFFKEHLKDRTNYHVTEDEYNLVRNSILNLEVMPSMRCLMTAGPALKGSEIAGYNCSFLAINRVAAFDEILYILMNGVGVGFSVERQHVSQLPTIAEEFHKSDIVIQVADSKLGWAKAFKELVSLLYSGQIPSWDVSKVREAGAILKTFGGRASGPGPLVDLFKFTVNLFKKAAGRKLNSTECHDLVCKIAEIVVVGGVRRSALISLSNLSDDRMRNAKSGQWWDNYPHRALANNSAAYTEKPEPGIFMEEWLALYHSKSGERGFFNRAGVQRILEKNGRRKTDFEFGTNPCSEIILRDREFCVAGDTKIITRNHGIVDIASIENKEVDIWNGRKWSTVTIRKTRENQKLVRVNLSDGSHLDCTEDHKFSVNHRFEKNWNKVEAKDLMQHSKYAIRAESYEPIQNENTEILEDAYTVGFAVGDGFVDRKKVKLALYGDKDQNCPVSGKRNGIFLKKGYNVTRQDVVTNLSPELISSLKTNVDSMYELAKYDRNSFLNFLAGLADADGAKASNGIRIYISNEERAKALHLVCSFNGIKSSVNLFQKGRTLTNFGPRTDDLWYLQITECNDIPCHRLNTQNGKPARWKGKYQIIDSVESIDGLHDVYCFTEHERHMGVFGNVLTYQCNLSEVVIRTEDDMDTLLRKVQVATIIGTWQSTLTNFKYISKKWQENCEEERLLGVSLTGIMDNTFTNSMKGLDKRLNLLKQIAITTNKAWAEKLGINQSVAVTCVKPSGTVSQLVDAASGIHARWSPYYIRTVRADKKDPLAKFMVSKGFPVEDDIMKPDSTYVFSFPIKAPKGSIFRNDKTAIEQLEIWKIYQDAWCEHKPSVTIYVKEDEWVSVAAWVYENFDYMSGVSFLPTSDHIYKQAPYQDATKREYEEFLNRMPTNVDWEELAAFEKEDNTVGSQELACSASGGCEI